MVSSTYASTHNTPIGVAQVLRVLHSLVWNLLGQQSASRFKAAHSVFAAHSFAANGGVGLAIGASVSATTGLVVMGEATGLAIGAAVSATTGLLVGVLTGAGVSTGLGEGEGVSPKQQYKNTSSIAMRRRSKRERERERFW